jgi:peptidoglycan glycosyltransferase
VTELEQNESTLAKINHVTMVILFSFVLVGAALVYWSVGRAEAILSREDNPRLAEAELRIQRGQILDRNSIVLAETVGEPDNLDRVYPMANSGPAVGYYSFRHGTAGVEEGLDDNLRGEGNSMTATVRRQLLHLPQTGQAVHLTVDIALQQTADSLLPTSPSALVLLALGDNTAQILALVSHPGYDPNLLDEQFEALTANEQAPLLNRVTQGQYQPGRVLQPFILAAAVEQGMINMLQAAEEVSETVRLNGQVIECLSRPPSPATWADVLQHSCPVPVMTLGDQLGASGLDQIFADFGLTQPPQLPLNTGTPPLVPLADPLLASIGQDNLLVTPLQVALAWAALAKDGRLPRPQLVTTVDNETGSQLSPIGAAEAGETAVSPPTAHLIRLHLAQTDNFLEHAVLVLSGPEGEMNAWYLGMTPADAPRYALVAVVEASADLIRVQTLGRALLAASNQ